MYKNFFRYFAVILCGGVLLNQALKSAAAKPEDNA